MPSKGKKSSKPDRSPISRAPSTPTLACGPESDNDDELHLQRLLSQASAKFPNFINESTFIGRICDQDSDFSEGNQARVWLSESAMVSFSISPGSLVPIGPEQIEALYQYAKFQFECGNYSAAYEFLYQYCALCTNSERSLSVLWRKLAAKILMQNWDEAFDELNCLKEIIDSKVHTNLEGSRSHAANTGWAMLALISDGQSDRDPKPLQHAVKALINMQMESGEFPQQVSRMLMGGMHVIGVYL